MSLLPFFASFSVIRDMKSNSAGRARADFDDSWFRFIWSKELSDSRDIFSTSLASLILRYETLAKEASEWITTSLSILRMEEEKARHGDQSWNTRERERQFDLDTKLSVMSLTSLFAWWTTDYQESESHILPLPQRHELHTCCSEIRKACEKGNGQDELNWWSKRSASTLYSPVSPISASSISNSFPNPFLPNRFQRLWSRWLPNQPFPCL